MIFSSTITPLVSHAAVGESSSTLAFVPDANMAREAIPTSYRWDLAPLFGDDAAFEAALAKAQEMRTTLAQWKGQLNQPAKLLACLEHYFSTRLLANKLTLYAGNRLVTDQKSTNFLGMSARALAAMNDLIAAATFIRQEVLALSDKAFTQAMSKEPGLARYIAYLEELRRRRSRLLSADAERTLALAGDNLWAEIDLNELPSDFEKTFDAMLGDIPLPTINDEAGKPVQLTLSSLPRYRASTDRRVRREAVERTFATLKQYENAFAATFAGQVRFSVFLARARGYSTALEAYLDKDNIDPAVYRNLVQTVNANLAPLHRYVALRKRVLGLTDLRLYDLYTPIVGKVDRAYSREDALRILPEALAPLGPDYVAVLRTGLDPANGWVDLYPHRNKESGAFCSSVYGLHPFVKMNYLNDLNSLSTLAHEFGHAMHGDLTMKSQPYWLSNYSMFIAEIASTFNEKLLNDYLLAHATTKQEKLFLLNKLAESIRTTIYRQTLFAEFELAAHTAVEQGTPLTAAWLNATYSDLVRRYYGPAFAVGENDGIEWAYVPHFYYKYYVYAYATGLSSGLALAAKVQAKEPGAREAYLGLLKGGSSKPPLELLRGAGLDLGKPDAIANAARLLDETVAQMNTLLE